MDSYRVPCATYKARYGRGTNVLRSGISGCLNARGAIAHGRKTENKFNNELVLKESVWSKSVDDMFSLLGGAKELCGAGEIKEEMMKNGPVVSTKFHPSETFCNIGNYPVMHRTVECETLNEAGRDIANHQY